MRVVLLGIGAVLLLIAATNDVASGQPVGMSPAVPCKVTEPNGIVADGGDNNFAVYLGDDVGENMLWNNNLTSADYLFPPPIKLSSSL